METQELKFTSKRENIHILEHFVNFIFTELNIDADYYSIVFTALNEAVLNAIVHGNKENPEKFVNIIMQLKPEGMSFLVKDEGKGFHFDNIPDPTEIDENNSFSEMKGIYLIKKLADRVVFSDNGSTIETIFNIERMQHKISIERKRILEQFLRNKYSKELKLN